MSTARLPTTSAERKKIALAMFFDYFPDAICAVAELIVIGQKQHGSLGWDRTKSNDHDDCLLRHFIDRGTVDTDGARHRTKMAIRALMGLQVELEQELGLPPPRGVSVPALLHAPEDCNECAKAPLVLGGSYKVAELIRQDVMYLHLQDVNGTLRQVRGVSLIPGKRKLVLRSEDSGAEVAFDETYPHPFTITKTPVPPCVGHEFEPPTLTDEEHARALRVACDAATDFNLARRSAVMHGDDLTPFYKKYEPDEVAERMAALGLTRDGQPLQLELPFTGKQLAVKDLTEADIGQKFRVVAHAPCPANFVGWVGVLDSFDGTPRAAYFRGRETHGVYNGRLCAELETWRFERVQG